MTKNEFSAAMVLAKAGKVSEACSKGLFMGFALQDFKQVCCTLEDMAGLISWQCFYLFGGIDETALNEIWAYRRKFLIVG